MLPSAMMLGSFMPTYGIGNLSMKELQQYLEGKNSEIPGKRGPFI